MVSDALPGKEEYLDCEKYELRHWDWSIENKLTHVIRKINEARNTHTSLQQTNNISFCTIDNEKLIAFHKWNDDRTNQVLVIINLDPYYAQRGTVQLPLGTMGLHEGQEIRMHDLVTDSSYLWYNEWNFVELHPSLPFHLFHINI